MKWIIGVSVIVETPDTADADQAVKAAVELVRSKGLHTYVTNGIFPCVIEGVMIDDTVYKRTAPRS